MMYCDDWDSVKRFTDGSNSEKCKHNYYEDISHELLQGIKQK